jgi:drug/metabolite transporter (DMT)-like permease
MALVLVYVLTGAAGDLMLTYGMRQHPVSAYWVGIALACFAASYGIFLGLLRELPLSVVVPAGAGSYLVITLLSQVLLREPVSPLRWAGTALVSTGVALVMISDREPRPPGAAAGGQPDGEPPARS